MCLPRAVVFATLLLMVAVPAGAQTTGRSRVESLASERIRLGLEEFRAGHFAQAAVDFEAAYESTHEASLLFNIGTSKYEADDLAGAAHAFDEYLRLVPDASNRG